MDAYRLALDFSYWLKEQARMVEGYASQREPQILQALHCHLTTMRDCELPQFHRLVCDAMRDMKQVQEESPIETAGFTPLEVQ